MYESKKTDYFEASRDEILGLLPEKAPNILEIGCGAGKTLEMLKRINLCERTVGIELFSDAASEAARRVDVVYCLDVEKEELPADIGKFDLVLLLDVLEHLVDPWMFLKKVREELLAEGGKCIISLPNARHFTLVLPLLFGNFNYAERGILDKTHLRFFTKSTMRSLIEDSGLEIEKINATSLDVSLNSGKLNFMTLGLFSGFLTSQYIFLAS